MSKHHTVHHQSQQHEYQYRAGLEPDTLALVARVKALEAAKPPPNERAVLTDFIAEAELADQLNVSIRSLREWRRRRQGPAATLIGRQIFYRAETVQNWLLSRQKRATRERAKRTTAAANE